MKLLEFEPQGYRGLLNLPVYFAFEEDKQPTHRCSIRFLAGLNGTGKSTILRFLAAIFAALDEGYQRDSPDNPAYNAGFRLRYQLRGDTIEIHKGERGRNELTFRINGEMFDGVPSQDRVLPQALLIYTSGDVRPWRELLRGRPPAEQEFVEQLPTTLLPDEEEAPAIFAALLPVEEQIQVPATDEDFSSDETNADEQIGDVVDRIVLVEPEHLPLAFLAASLAQIAEQEQNTSVGADFRQVLQHVGVDQLVSFSLRLRYDPSGLSEAQRRRLQRLARAATLTLFQFGTWLWVYNLDDRRDGIGPATQLMPDLKSNPGLSFQLFQDLVRLHEDSKWDGHGRSVSGTEGQYSEQTTPHFRAEEPPLSIYEVNLIVNKPIKRGNDQTNRLLLFADLSDGERAYLSRMALVHLLGKRESLFLLDEPETHFNDEWKRNLVDQIERTLEGSDSEVILTSHASIVLTDAYPEEVVLLTEDGQQGVPLTFAAEQNELLRSIFGADRSVGKRAVRHVRDVLENGTAEQLQELLDQVGPGYFRFKVIEALESRVSQDQSS